MISQISPSRRFEESSRLNYKQCDARRQTQQAAHALCVKCNKSSQAECGDNCNSHGLKTNFSKILPMVGIFFKFRGLP